MIIGMAVNSEPKELRNELAADLDIAALKAKQLQMFVEGRPFDELLKAVSRQLVVRETHIKVENDDFTCLCGNNTNAQGAFPCDREGNYVDPTPDEWPSDLFRCDKCGIIFEQGNGKIVGRFAANKGQI